MIAETAIERLLQGFRTLPAGDEAALVELVTAVSAAYERYDVEELELNPVVVTDDGAYAVDLLVD
jgi:succinyl-CoA synthetase beta subunit